MERKRFEDDEKGEGNPDDTSDFRVLFPLAAPGAERRGDELLAT